MNGTARSLPAVACIILIQCFATAGAHSQVQIGSGEVAVNARPAEPAHAEVREQDRSLAAIEDSSESQPLSAGSSQALSSPSPSTTNEDESLGGLNQSGSSPMSGPEFREIVQVLGALGVVIGLLLLGRFVFARNSGALGGSVGRPSGVLEILGRYPIARGQQLVLLKLARRVLLVHQSGAAMTTLSEVHEPEEVASLLSRVEAGSSGRDATRFRSLLDQFRKEHEQADGPAETGEIVDLTRRQTGGLSGLLGWRRSK